MASAPASCIWYPLIEMELNFGIYCENKDNSVQEQIGLEIRSLFCQHSQIPFSVTVNTTYLYQMVFADIYFTCFLPFA